MSRIRWAWCGVAAAGLTCTTGGCAVPALANEPATSAPAIAAPEWRRVDENTRKVASLTEAEQLARDIPWSRSVRLALLNAYLEADRKPDAYAEIVRLADTGYLFSANAERAFLEMFEGAERGKLAEILAIDRPPLEASQVAATVPTTALLVESAALDPATGRMFAASIVSQALFVKEPGAEAWTRLPVAEAGGLAGMAIDKKGRTLWVASGIYDEMPRPEGAFSGLIGIPLDGGSERRIAAPAGTTPSDLLLAPDGTLYAADPLRGAIYRAAPGETSLAVLIGPGTFRSPQGMVAVGANLLVSDWGYGLALVEPASGKVWRVDPDSPVLLDGIDGMWHHGDEIVAIQNGARPGQVVAFRLADQGTRVTGWRVLERGVPGWTEPASGSLAGDALIYVGNGQWDRFAKGGVLRDGKQPEPTQLRRLELKEKPVPPPKNPG